MGEILKASAINQKIVAQSAQQALSAYGFINQDLDEYQIAVAEAEEED